MADNEIIWDASVDDSTMEFFKRFDDNLDRAANAAEGAFDSVEKNANKSGKEIGLVAGLVGGLTTKLIELGMQGVAAMKQYVTTATQMRARADTLAITLNQMGLKAGYSAEQIAEAEEGVKSMGITTLAARQSLVRLTRANIDWSEATNLARIAQDSAVVAGINSSQAFERLILGIQKQEPELLDELGITLKRTDAYKAMADTLGKTVKQLSEAEKQQAILNDIYRQSGIVAGSYEAAMGSAGKQASSMARHTEELQLAIGGAFQPAYSMKIEFMTERLKELRQWVEDNGEALEEFGLGMEKAMEVAIDLFAKLTEQLVKFPSLVKDAGVSLAQVVGQMDDAEAAGRAQGNVTYERFAQLISLLVGYFSSGVTIIWETAGVIKDTFAMLWTMVTDGMDAGNAAADALGERISLMDDKYRESMISATTATAELLGIVKEVEEVEPMADAVQPLVELAAATVDVSAALSEVTAAMSALKEGVEDEAMARAIAEQRRKIEEELKNTFRLIDIEKKFQADLKSIRDRASADMADAQENYSEEVIDAQQNRSDRMLDIERDYRERLAQIRDDFERDATELARSRDAIGLIRLIENNSKTLDEARQQRDKERSTASEDYDARMEDLRDSLSEQEAAIAEFTQAQLAELMAAREEEAAAYAEQLDRQRQLRQLHDQWESEDRAAKLRKELEEMAEQFTEIEGLTADGLDSMLAEWEEYFGDLGYMVDIYNAKLAESTAMMSVGGSSSSMFNIGAGQTTPGGGAPVMLVPGELPGHGGGIFGQAGQVSSMLAEPQRFGVPTLSMPNSVSPLPAVGGSKMDKREIVVRAEGFSPQVERMVVASLLEIERNRG